MDYLLQLAASPTAWVALATLVVMEIVLGIDNLIFISILTNKLPEQHRQKARRIGIGMALILRLGLLSTIAFIVQLTAPVIEILGHAYSWKDMILIAGGLFLLWKATTEIHHSMDPAPDDPTSKTSTVTLGFAAAIGDPDAGHGVFHRQHHYRCRHDRAFADHDHRGGGVGAGDVVCR